MTDHDADQKRLEQEQALSDLDQSIADREQALANVDQATIERDQSKLDEERAKVDPSDFARSVGFAHRQSEVDRRQDRSDARQDQVDQAQTGGDQRQTLLDDQQYELEQPRPVALTAAQVQAERETRGQAARVRDRGCERARRGGAAARGGGGAACAGTARAPGRVGDLTECRYVQWRSTARGMTSSRPRRIPLKGQEAEAPCHRPVPSSATTRCASCSAHCAHVPRHTPRAQVSSRPGLWWQRTAWRRPAVSCAGAGSPYPACPSRAWSRAAPISDGRSATRTRTCTWPGVGAGSGAYLGGAALS